MARVAPEKTLSESQPLGRDVTEIDRRVVA